MIDKPLLRQRFGTAVHSYDDTAIVQRRVVDLLAELLPYSSAPLRVLEIGCGTGLLSRRLVEKYPTSNFTFNDIAPEVEQSLRLKVGPRHSFVANDAEQSTWSTGYHLIASSSCIQWWMDPLAFFRKAHTSLRHEGRLLYSTFLPGTLHELSSTTGSGLHYPSEEAVVEVMSALHYRDVHHEVQATTLYFDTFIELLHHIRQTGANAIPTHTVWTPSMLRRLEQDFLAKNHLTLGDPLPLTYKTIIGTAIK